MRDTVRHEMTESVTAYEEKLRDQWLFDYPAQVYNYLYFEKIVNEAANVLATRLVSNDVVLGRGIMTNQSLEFPIQETINKI